MPSGKIIDLRPGARKPPRDQRPLFSPQSSPPKKRMPLRARRRRARLAVSLFVLALIAFAAWGVSYVSYLPRYNIQSISVEGASAVPADVIQSYVQTILSDGRHHFLSRSNIFLYPKAVIERDLAKDFPRIKAASLSRASLMSTAITVSVQERQEFALWCGEGGSACYSMDQGGFIFAQTQPAASSTLYVFEGGIATSSDPIGQLFAASHVPGLIVLLQTLGQAGFTPKGITVVSDQDFAIPLSNGSYVKASFGEDAGQLVKNLQIVLSSDALRGRENDLEYIDLRFGDRVYYKLRGQTEAGTQQ